MRHLLTALLVVASTLSHAREVAFTFDDAPRKASGFYDGPTRAQKLLQELEDHQVGKVAFFANTSQLEGERLQRLKAYGDAGHIIANHSHTHPNFNGEALQAYIDDVHAADQALGIFPTFKKWFRFPYLREGNTPAKRDGMRHYLDEQGYLNAYITLNNYDWYIEALFQEAVARGIEVDLAKLRHFYLDVMIAGIEYYDQLSITHLGRSPKHVLLMHEMDITALFVGDLADTLRAKGWSIISPEEAYTDEIANYSTSSVLTYNPGRIGEIAYDNGHKTALWHETLNEDTLRKRFEAEVLGAAARHL
ncbi:polysaccharide deacetylase [Microbulbifer flavimaris]|uniref:Polysaccharide deacetylase n=1 Tax=Microbulbifer flavimaris TaxID=1781068 RepID=A0ABX4I2K4_9GAMM|nr:MULTISPECIES: polysaccharide deacetylase family protein [Microbulbifer]KUJ84203.1 polysaccharide deacetylase [Microbulbifer sp. ZGT114]PCO06278.1 polysaccharide deacetylase [Microbulbifer flavimaris]